MVSRAIRAAAALVTLAVAMTGCASGGNEVLRSQDANAVDRNIIDGKTTRSEVERIYGPPNATSFANAQTDIWIYRWVRSTAKAENFIPYVGAFVGGRDIQQKELVILFNEQNVVARHSMRDSTDSIRRNLSSSSSPTPSAAQISTSAGAAAGARFVRCRALSESLPRPLRLQAGSSANLPRQARRRRPRR